jgi:hypothetical protein
MLLADAGPLSAIQQPRPRTNKIVACLNMWIPPGFARQKSLRVAGDLDQSLVSQIAERFGFLFGSAKQHGNVGM